MTSFEQRLADETRAWAREGLVSESQADAIRARYAGTAVAARRDRFVQVLSVLGAVGVGLGVILFFAANWDGIPRVARLVLLVAAVVAAYAGGDRIRRSYERLGHAFQLLGCILFGASLFLVGQMENVSGDEALAFALWTAAAAAGAVLLRSAPFAGLAALTGGAAIGFELDRRGAGDWILFALFLYAGAVYALGSGLRVPILRVFAAVGVLATLFPMTFGDVSDDAIPFLNLGPLLPNIAFVALAAAAVAAGYLREEPWLANLGLAALVIEIAVRFFDYFARIMPRSLAFLAGGVLALALAWALERNRRHMQRRAAR